MDGNRTFDPAKASRARVYDALLGGKDNFAAEREAAEQLAAKAPEVHAVSLGGVARISGAGDV